MFAPYLRALVVIGALVLARVSSAQGDDPPVMSESVLTHMPVLNGTSWKDDPPSRVENDISAYQMGDSDPGDTGVPTDENDTGDAVGLHNGMVSYRAVDLVIPERGAYPVNHDAQSTGYWTSEGWCRHRGAANAERKFAPTTPAREKKLNKYVKRKFRWHWWKNCAALALNAFKQGSGRDFTPGLRGMDTPGTVKEAANS